MDTENKTTLRALLSGDSRLLAALELKAVDTYTRRADEWVTIPSVSFPDHAKRGEELAALGGADYSDAERADSLDVADVVTHDMLGGSDYSGGALVRANRRAAEREHDGSGVLFHLHGGHGTEELCFLLDVPGEADALASIVDTLRHLTDYPVVDDGELSEVETEDEGEAWESYARADFANALAERFGMERGSVSNPKGDKGDILADYFRTCAERGNVNGGPGIVHEDTGPCFLCDDVAESASMAECAALGLLSEGLTEALADVADDDAQEARDEARRLRRAEKNGRALASLASRLDVALPDMIRDSRVDAGEESAPLSAECVDNPELRGLTVTFRRFDWQAGGPCTEHKATVRVDSYRESADYVVDGTRVAYYMIREALEALKVYTPKAKKD